MNLIWEEDWETDVPHWAPETEVHSKMYCVIWTCTQPKLLTFNGLSQCLTNYNSSANCIACTAIIPYLFSLGHTCWRCFCWRCIWEATLLFFTKWYVSLCCMFIKTSTTMRTLHIIWIGSRWRRGRERTTSLLSCCHTPCCPEVRDKLFMFSPPVWLWKKIIICHLTWE